MPRSFCCGSGILRICGAWQPPSWRPCWHRAAPWKNQLGWVVDSFSFRCLLDAWVFSAGKFSSCSVPAGSSWPQGADHSRCFRLLSYLLWAFPWLSHCAPPLSATPGSPQAWALPWKLIGGLHFFAFWVRPPWFGSFLVDWRCTDSRAPGRHALRHANSVVPRFLVRSSCPFAASPHTCMSHVNHHPRRDFYFW